MKSPEAQLAGMIALGLLLLTRWSAAQGLPDSPASLSEGSATTLNGNWRASSMIVQWAIGDWGKACGPRPATAGEPGGVAAVKQRGRELLIVGPGRSFSTANCWEQYPGLSRSSHRAGSRGWSTVCKTATSDPRRATIKTSVRATNDTLNFDETGQYQFLIEGQNCTASSRRTRSYKRIQATVPAPKTHAPEPLSPRVPTPKVPTPKAPTASKPKVTTASTCSTPGPANKIEVSPARKLMRSGESFSFRTRITTASGCRLAPSLTNWRLEPATEFAAVDVAGSVTIAEQAPDTKLGLIAQVGAKSLRVEVHVVSQQTYDQLLSGGEFTLSGESKGGTSLNLAAASVSTITAVGEDAAGTRKLWFVALSSAVALLLGGFGVALIRQAGRQSPPAVAEPATRPQPEKINAPGVKLNPVAANPTKVCPSCGTMYAADSQFCGRDGTTLIHAT